MSELGRSPPTPSGALPDPTRAENVLYNPSVERLRALSRDLEQETTYGSPSYVSAHRSRAADRTRNAIDSRFDATDYRTLDRALRAARTNEMVCLDRRLGRDGDLSFTCRYYVPKRYARIALALATLLEPARPTGDPDFVTVQIPDADAVAIRVFPDAGVTAVMGTDYTGEAKKSFLRLFMYEAKRRGGLGLHAGSKRVTVRDDQGHLREVGQLFLGLSATGKSTLTAHGLGLDPPESAVMLQDDVCGLMPDGSAAGSEGNGLYVKTHGLDSSTEPGLYQAVTDETAVLENVDVRTDGRVDFTSDHHTSNGRAAIRRDRLPSAATDIDLDRVDQIFFITRNPLMPPVTKLDPAEAAAAFMCGESIETSAGDPTRAGEPVRVVGTNPFIIGPEAGEGNRFRALVEALDVECFVLNTGSIGRDGRDICVSDSVAIVRELARGTVSWTRAAASGYTVPERVPGLDMTDCTVDQHVDGYAERIESLRAERRAYLHSFDGLDESITAGF